MVSSRQTPAVVTVAITTSENLAYIFAYTHSKLLKELLSYSASIGSKPPPQFVSEYFKVWSTLPPCWSTPWMEL